MEIDYYKREELSQSKLKKILIHPLAFRGERDYSNELPNEKTLIGNAVDCLLTEGEESFNKKFEILKETVSFPSGQFGSFVELLFTYRDKLVNEDSAWDEDTWYETCFNMVKSKVAKLEDFKSKFENDFDNAQKYYNYLILSTSKQVLTLEQYEKVMVMKTAYETSSFTAPYITKTSSNIVIPQLEILWKTPEGVSMKSKLDFLIIDFQQKTIRIVDLKSTESLKGFEYVFWKHRYDFQGATYTLAVKDWIKRETNFGDLKDFTFLPYTLLVQSTTYPGNPVAIELTDNTMDIGLNGGIKGDKVYEGFNQAIERFLFHSQTDQWEFPMEVYKNNGILYI